MLDVATVITHRERRPDVVDEQERAQIIHQEGRTEVMVE